jgi:hypothetical protein
MAVYRGCLPTMSSLSKAHQGKALAQTSCTFSMSHNLKEVSPN